MSKKILIFDSHPVQYRVPVWRAMQNQNPGTIHVVYASDCSVRGHADEGFGKTISWDDPMLEGYDHTILNCEKGKPLSGWGSLTGHGVSEVLDKMKPDAILLTGLNYRYDAVAYIAAIRRGIPVWLRCETQDEASHRSKWKGVLRSWIYRTVYLKLNRVFYIGELNKQHYQKHGVSAEKLHPARYGTVDRFERMPPEEKQRLRNSARSKAVIANDAFVIGFSGKFIPKKNPDILFQMLSFLPKELRRRTHIYFLGSGEMEQELRAQANEALNAYGVKTFFAGFVNQSDLAGHYLAMDIMVLPSRKMGETWGLVANEAMQAGCGVIVSDAVGSSRDFANWERFRVFKEADAQTLAGKVTELAAYPRNFDWALKALDDYTIEAIANALEKEIKKLP